MNPTRSTNSNAPSPDRRSRPLQRSAPSLALAAAPLLLLLLLSHPAHAQVPPFFNGGGGIFDPEIGVVQSGVILDAQSVVSADRKYVTLTTRLQNAQLLALREFAFQTGGNAPGGQLGGANAAGNVFGRGAAADSHHALPSKPYPKPREATGSSAGHTSVLDKQGMTLVGRVDGTKKG